MGDPTGDAIRSLEQAGDRAEELGAQWAHTKGADYTAQWVLVREFEGLIERFATRTDGLRALLGRFAEGFEVERRGG